MTTTKPPPDTGTIDITNLVNTMESTFVLLGKNYLIGLLLAIPGVGPVAAWFINNLFGSVIDWLLTKLATWEVMQAFFLNTAVRKASQAADYVDTVNAKNNLPPTATDKEYQDAENTEMAAFRNFVMVTN